MARGRIQLPDGTIAVWYRRLTEPEWERIAAKRSKGPKATLEEFWLIVLEEIGSPQDEPLYVWEVVLHPMTPTDSQRSSGTAGTLDGTLHCSCSTSAPGATPETTGRHGSFRISTHL